MKEPA